MIHLGASIVSGKQKRHISVVQATYQYKKKVTPPPFLLSDLDTWGVKEGSQCLIQSQHLERWNGAPVPVNLAPYHLSCSVLKKKVLSKLQNSMQTLPPLHPTQAPFYTPPPLPLTYHLETRVGGDARKCEGE